MNGPIRTIVVGLAELQEEDPQLAPTIELAESLNAALHVVHAFRLPDPILYPSAGVSVFSPEAIEQIREGVRSVLEAQVRKISGSARIHCQADPVPADRAILDVAEEVGPDLIVVGATRRGTLAQTILGTTAQRVVRATQVPVLVNRLPGHGPLRRVLLTTDLSEPSARVYERALELVPMLGAADMEARALLVLGYDFAPPPPLSRGALLEAGGAELDRFLKRVEPSAPASRGKIRTGDPAKEIVAEAAEWGADLLVVGTHGRTGTSRFLLGSVAESVVRNALCDVLVIPNAAASSTGGVPVDVYGDGP
jgi:nucleotide-binding universal stress UspA family protein